MDIKVIEEDVKENMVDVMIDLTKCEGYAQFRVAVQGNDKNFT